MLRVAQPFRVLRRAAVIASASLVGCGALGTATSSAAAERIAGCTQGTRHAATWEETNGIADDFVDDIRASSVRHAYAGLSFDQHHKKVDLYLKNHRHDAAVKACAAELKIGRFLRISIHRWSDGQLLRALRRVEDALPELYDAQVFECSYGVQDRFDIDIYATATDDDVARIKHEAEKTHVAFKIHRLTTDAPEFDNG